MKNTVILKANSLNNEIKIVCDSEPFDGRVVTATSQYAYFKQRAGRDTDAERRAWNALRHSISADLRKLFESMGYVVVEEELT